MFAQTTYNYSHQLLRGTPLQEQDCNKLWIHNFTIVAIKTFLNLGMFWLDSKCPDVYF